MVGRVPAGSVQDNLPPWLVAAWGTVLLGGSVTALVGSYWRGNYANGITLERVGLNLVGSAGTTYALLILATAGMSGLLAGGIVLAFGLACMSRATDIAIIVRRALTTPAEVRETSTVTLPKPGTP
jgi:hypothetical protein